MNDLEARLNSLQLRYRRMVWGLWILAVVMLAGIAVLRERPAAASPAENSGEVLRLKGLVIVDENGTERVRIGAPLPGQLVNGKREQRPSRQAGYRSLR